MTEKCECYATISRDDPRHALWIRVTPDGHIPLKHPLTVKASDGPFAGQLFYEGDPTRLTDEQKQILAEICAEKFSLSKDNILADLAKGILPISVKNVSVSICNLHFRCML